MSNGVWVARTTIYTIAFSLSNSPQALKLCTNQALHYYTQVIKNKHTAQIKIISLWNKSMMKFFTLLQQTASGTKDLILE